MTQAKIDNFILITLVCVMALLSVTALIVAIALVASGNISSC